MALFDQIEIDNLIVDDDYEVLERAPSDEDQLGGFDIACLFVNRTIGKSLAAISYVLI